MSRLLIVLGVLELIVVMAMGWMLGPRLEDRFVPGVWVWDLSLGGMSYEEAQHALESALPLHDPHVVLLGPEGQRWSFSPAELGMSLDAAATLLPAFEVGHGDEQAIDTLSARLSAMMDGERFSPVLAWNEDIAYQALSTISEEIDRPAQDAAVRLEGAQVRLAPGGLGRRVEISQTLDLLLPHLYAMEPAEIVVPITDLAPDITDDQAQQALSMAQQILESPLNLLVPDPREGDPGPWEVAPEVLARMLIIRIEQDGVRVGMDGAALAQFLSPMAVALYREPVDATFDFDMDTLELVPLSPSQVGREMDVPASVERINESLRTGEHWVSLVVDEIPPERPDTLTAEDLGIRELVAVGESYFTGSSSARDSNIRLGASKFDGVIVAPDEVFSFNEHLGEVTLEAGYDESYVIIGDRTVPGVGGGICQVATTAFRAAYFGGYPIVERWPHAYRVSYYELGGFGPGFDATIYSPLVDFRFKNDSPYHILIHTEVDSANARLRFMFYSTDDGRTVEQVGPEWGDPIPPGAPVYEYDATMAAGTVVQLERAKNGLNATLGRVVRDADGNVLYDDTFVSKFIPWPARYKYGPGYTPPSNAEVISTPQP
ncbi:MAG: VanW family protein [Anaerolineae bacterium]